MISIEYKWGANYLVSDEGMPELELKSLTSQKGDVINIGDAIVSFGSKDRTKFELIPNVVMYYEGVWNDSRDLCDQSFAIFRVDNHQLAFDNKIYRYCFNIIMDKDNNHVHCFLTGSYKGMRDIMLDPIKRG